MSQIITSSPALQKTLTFNNQIYHRYDIHLDWERINKGQFSRLIRILHRMDRDIWPEDIYPDGCRFRWRHPMFSLEEFLFVLKQHRISSGRGWCLPSGWNCTKHGDEDPCTLGYAFSCRAKPEEKDWFTWEIF